MNLRIGYVRVSPQTSGRHLRLVTGRPLDDVQRAVPHPDLFERVVAGNGALQYYEDIR